jgi:signal transduction histidine kinase
VKRRRARRGRGLDARERHALEIHDNLVQGLTAIHWALEAGAYEQARATTSATLAQAQAMIGDLLEDNPERHTFAPGALRREAAATARSSAR